MLIYVNYWIPLPILNRQTFLIIFNVAKNIRSVVLTRTGTKVRACVHALTRYKIRIGGARPCLAVVAQALVSSRKQDFAVAHAHLGAVGVTVWPPWPAGPTLWRGRSEDILLPCVCVFLCVCLCPYSCVSVCVPSVAHQSCMTALATKENKQWTCDGSVAVLEPWAAYLCVWLCVYLDRAVYYTEPLQCEGPSRCLLRMLEEGCCRFASSCSVLLRRSQSTWTMKTSKTSCHPLKQTLEPCFVLIL